MKEVLLQKQNIFDEIKQVSDIVSEISIYVDLVKKGRNYWGICPFHDDTSPSMSVSPEKQFFKCFVCQVGGNVINFIANFEKIPFVNAAKKLADKNGIVMQFKGTKTKEYSDKEQKLLSVIKEAMNFFQYSISTDEGDEAHKYLIDRGITQKDIDKFSIGYAPSTGLVKFLESKGYEDSTIINASLSTEKMSDFFRNRIIFGIKNTYGQHVGFSARTLDPNNKTKYINSAETPLFNKSKILYNYSNAETMIQRNKEVIIVEGFMDVIALDHANIYNTVAIMGTALTREHSKYLKGKNIVMMLDSDEAGQKATIKSIKSMLAYNRNIYVVNNDTGLDPDEFLKVNGKVALQELTQKRIHALDFIFQKHIEKFGIAKGASGIEFAKSFANYLIHLEQGYKDIYISKLSQVTGLKEETVISYIKTEKVIEEPIKIPENFIIPNESEGQVNKSKQRENKFIIRLFSAMTNKQKFIYTFMDHTPMFSDSMNIVLGKYLIALKLGKNTTNIINKEELRERLIGYRDYGEVPTDDEFNNLLKEVNRCTNAIIKNKRLKRLTDEKTEEEKIKILEDLIKSTKGDK